MLPTIGLVLSLSLAADPERLTIDGRIKTDPVFIGNSADIAYTLLESPTQMRLMKRTPDGRSTPLHPQATTNEFEPTFTPDAAMIAFVQSRGNLNLKLIIREVSTGKESVFDAGGGFASLRRPSFFPDGRKVAFSIPSGNGHAIVTVNAQAMERKTLTEGGLNNWPHVRRDGQKIVFCSSRDGTFDLYVMDADGGNVKRLLKTTGADFRPSWSPDGKRIVFTSNQDGNYDIWLVHADGSGLQRLTTHPERDDYPTWAPDGKSIVFVGEREGKFDLYRLPIAE